MERSGGGGGGDAQPSGVHFKLSSSLQLSTLTHPPPHSLSSRLRKGKTPLQNCESVKTTRGHR